MIIATLAVISGLTIASIAAESLNTAPANSSDAAQIAKFADFKATQPAIAFVTVTKLCDSAALTRFMRLGDLPMSDHLDLDKMQAAYQAAVEEWIAAIRQEEALASVNHTVAEVDKWEAAHFKEDEIRSKVKAAKKRYEDALREKFFGF